MTLSPSIIQHRLELYCRLRLSYMLAMLSYKVHIIAAGPGEEQHSPHNSHEQSQSLSDGRMDVGTHLPLMAKRYAYLSLLGEGTSAQVEHHSCGCICWLLGSQSDVIRTALLLMAERHVCPTILGL